MIHSLLRRWLGPRHTNTIQREPIQTRLSVEALESRDQPSALPVAAIAADTVPTAAREFDPALEDDFFIDDGSGFEDDPFAQEPVFVDDPFLQEPVFFDDPFAPAPFLPFADPELVFINQLVIANLQAIFAQPILPGGPVLGAAITGINDLDGDGFFDVSAVVVLHAGRGQLIAFALDFDGLSPYGELLAPPTPFVPGFFDDGF